MNNNQLELTYDRRKKLSPKEILRQAVVKYNIRHMTGLFSGGKDSYLTCHMTAEIIKELEQELGIKIQWDVLHCYTGTGNKKTFKYVLDIATKEGWQLYVEYPEENSEYPQNAYIKVLHERGFLGRPWHSVWLKALKYNSMVRFQKKNPDTWFVSGKAPTNSKRRKKQMEKAVRRGKTVESLYMGKEDRIQAVKPMFYLTKADTWKMIQERGLQIIESYKFTGHSEECRCPAFATVAEYESIKMWEPADARDIDILDEQYGGWHMVQDKRGRWYEKNFGKWGQPPKGKTTLDEEQRQLGEDLEDIACFDCSAGNLDTE